MQADRPVRRRWLRVALAATLILGACATEEGAEDQDDDAAATTTREAAEEISVTARDYAFDGIPAQIDAGSRLTLQNSSAKEVHELIAFKLPEGETRPVADIVKLPEADLEKIVAGEPAAGLVAMPNSDGMVVVGDGALSEAGRYIFVCFVPTGADPAAFQAAMQAAMQNPQGGPPNVPGGPPHVAQGMFAEATVQ